MITTKVKDGRCSNQYPTNMFLVLTMEVFSDGFSMLVVLLVIFLFPYLICFLQPRKVLVLDLLPFPVIVRPVWNPRPSILYLFLPLCWVLCFIDDWKVFKDLFPKALGYGPKFLVYFGCSIAELKNLLGFTFFVKLDVIILTFSLVYTTPPTKDSMLKMEQSKRFFIFLVKNLFSKKDIFMKTSTFLQII